uniref:alpha/beta hydrolase n=1 Tax=Paractinoplanes polyasparticus TaxID=2856853 RepID=UPI0034DB0BE2
MWRADAWASHASAPDTTWGFAWFNRPCAVWPAPSGTAAKVDGSQAPAGLLVHEKLDAAAPFAGGLTVRGLFPRSSLVALPGGTSHAAALTGNTCVDGAIAAYLEPFWGGGQGGVGGGRPVPVK